jgi:hypothetical protein
MEQQHQITTSFNRDTYHKTTSINGIPLMNSGALKYAYPGEGGSVARLNMYLEGREEKEEEKEHQTLGSLLHSYLEKPDKFAIEPADKPDPWICEIIDYCFPTLITLPGGVSSIKSIVDIVDDARKTLGIQPRWGAEAVAKNVFEKGSPYFTFLLQNNGKTMVSAANKDKLEGMKKGIENSRYANAILNDEGWEKEVAILWNHEGIPCKSLIDRMKKTIVGKTVKVNIQEIKTTSEPVSSFMSYKSVDFIEDKPVHRHKPGPMYRYRYYRQLPFYEKAIHYDLGNQVGNPFLEYEFEHGFFVVGSVPPYEVAYYQVPVHALWLGRTEINEAWEVTKQLYRLKGHLQF